MNKQYNVMYIYILKKHKKYNYLSYDRQTAHLGQNLHSSQSHFCKNFRARARLRLALAWTAILILTLLTLCETYARRWKPLFSILPLKLKIPGYH